MGEHFVMKSSPNYLLYNIRPKNSRSEYNLGKAPISLRSNITRRKANISEAHFLAECASSASLLFFCKNLLTTGFGNCIIVLVR